MHLSFPSMQMCDVNVDPPGNSKAVCCPQSSLQKHAALLNSHAVRRLTS